MLLLIPIVNIIMLYRAWHDSCNGKEQFWNEDYYYYFHDRRKQWIFDIGSVAVAGLGFWLLILSAALPYKGPVTREEYVANVNQYMLMSQMEGRLEEDGFWLNADRKPRHRIQTDEQGYVIQVEMLMPEHDPNEDHSSSISFSRRYSMNDCYENLHLCMLALTGREEDEGTKQLAKWAAAQDLYGQPPEEQEIVCGQWQVSMEEAVDEDSDGCGPYLLRICRMGG